MDEIKKEGFIKLDWYKDWWPIEIVESVSKYEMYSGNIQIPNITFAFLTSYSWFSENKAKRIATIIEQLRLLWVVSNPKPEFKTFFFPIKEEIKRPEIVEELLEDWAYDNSAKQRLEAALRSIDESDRIIYQRRREWQYNIYDNIPYEYCQESKVALSARFEFVVLPKDAKQIISI